MEHKPDEGKKSIQDQVKEILLGLGGGNGEFLNRPAPATSTENWGQLFNIVISFKCRECNVMHFGGFSPEQFLKVFAGKHAKNYFGNFSAIGMFEAGQLPIEKSDIDRLLQKAEELEVANAGLKKHLKYVQSLADEVTIEKSHLKVENDVLRRELDKYRRGGEQPGETALDFRASKRQWKFAAVIKTIRTIGEGR
jgi:hypothetical protein